MRRALRRTSTCLALAVLPLLPPPAGAQAADPVQAARQQVAALQAEVDRTAAQLTAGTRRLEQDRSALAEVQRRLSRARRDARDAQLRSSAARDRLRLVVGAAYRSPLPDSFVLALSGPDEFRSAVVAQADLQRVRGRQADLLSDATAERVRAQDAVRSVEQLTGDAARRARDVEQQVQRLRALAQDTERRLSAAAGRLSAAQDAARAARQRAARARATQAAAGPAVPRCTSDGGGGANGFLPASALCPLAGAPGQALRADAAAAFHRLAAASRATRGTGLCVTDSYRSYRDQVSVYARKPDLAAVPGTSRHGYGVAVDFGCGVERFGSKAYRWMKANGPRYGWVHPAWAEPGGSMPEPWHWEYVG